MSPQIEEYIVFKQTDGSKERTNTDHDIVEAKIVSIEDSNGTITCMDSNRVTYHVLNRRSADIKYIHSSVDKTLEIRQYEQNKILRRGGQNEASRKEKRDLLDKQFIHKHGGKYCKVKFGSNDRVGLSKELVEVYGTFAYSDESDDSDNEESDDEDTVWNTDADSDEEDKDAGDANIDPQLEHYVVFEQTESSKQKTNTNHDVVEAKITAIAGNGSITCEDDDEVEYKVSHHVTAKFLHSDDETTQRIREYKLKKIQQRVISNADKSEKIDKVNKQFVHKRQGRYYKVTFDSNNQITLSNELDETFEEYEQTIEDEEDNSRKRKRNSEDSDSDSDDEDDTEKKKLKQQIEQQGEQIEQQAEQIKQQDEQLKQQGEQLKQLEAKLQQEQEQFQNIPNKQALLQLRTQNPDLFAAYVTCMTGGFDSNNGSGDDKRNAVEKMEALGHKGQPLRQVLGHISEMIKEQKYEYLVQDREKAYQGGLAPFKDELHELDEKVLEAKKSKKEQEGRCDQLEIHSLVGLPPAHRQYQLKPYVDNLRDANTAYDNKLQEMKECHEKINTQLVELKENTEKKTKYKLVANTPEGRKMEWSNGSKFDTVKPERLQMPTEEE